MSAFHHQQKPPPLADLMSSLGAVYEKSGKAEDFKEEKLVFQHLLPKLIEALNPLVLSPAFALGSTATVWEVKDENLGQKRALKLARPRLGKLDKIIRVIRTERDTLATLTHQNITKIYLSDEIEISIDSDLYSFPYFLMDYLEGVKDFDEFVIENLDRMDGELAISYFRDVASGLCYLHDNHIIHCDIKPANIIIAPDSPALVADLGYAKHLERIPEGNRKKITSVSHTPQFAHPALREQMVRSTDPDASITVIERKKLRHAFDLYAFGRTLQMILREIREKENMDNKERSIFSPYQWRYLSLIAVRLLDGQVETINEDPLSSDTTLGLPRFALAEIKYGSASEALDDFEKLLNLYDLEGEIPELNTNLNTYIQLIGSRVPFTQRVSKVINHPCFIRLAQVTQLGFASLVYPGANHTRFEHSLGTFEKCCRIVRSLWYDRINCFFRSLMSKKDIEAVMLASLLHDIGQYPMGHDLAEVHAEFSPGRFTEGFIEFLDLNTNLSLVDVMRAEWGIEANDVFSILKADEKAGLKARVLNSIISGPLDADKLDYLGRDAQHLGVTFGKDIDVERLLRNLTVCLKVNEKGALEVCEIGVEEKARAVAESVWRARRDMFRQVYWHHSMRALKGMLMFVVRRIFIGFKNDSIKQMFVGNLHKFCFSPLSFIQTLYNVTDKEKEECLERGDFDVEDSFVCNGSPCDQTTHLSPADDALIAFLWSQADEMGRNVLSMVRQRRLYKRIAVLSHTHEVDIFDKVYNRFRQNRIYNDPQRQEEDRKALENGIMDCFSANGENRIIEEQKSENAPVILLDVPLKALRDPPGNEGLWYIPEEQIGLTDGDVFGSHSVAKSKVQIERTTFDKEVGKIRVLVHPSWKDAIKQRVSSNEILELLREM